MTPVIFPLFYLCDFSGMRKRAYALAALFCIFTGALNAQISTTMPMRSCVFKTYSPRWDSTGRKMIFRNQHAPFGRKFLRASGWVFLSEAIEMTVLLNSNTDFSKWERWKLGNLHDHYKAAYTLPPVIDRDDWFTNYVEHPFQGALNYNALRSQGAPIWQSAMFSALHSTFWEYVIEASEERPSIQDLIVTPIAGSLLGEMIHQVTILMSRNGFTWYETIIVLFLDPTFILNNGFKFNKPLRHCGKLRMKNSFDN